MESEDEEMSSTLPLLSSGPQPPPDDDDPLGTQGIRVVSLFDGISVGALAVEAAEMAIRHYYAWEVDADALAVSGRRWRGTVESRGDVRGRDWDGLGRIDLLLAAPPCQDLTRFGTRRGLAGKRSSLFSLVPEAIEAIKPEYWIVENVISRWSAQISDALGVDPVAINSDRFVQQNRPRHYWTNIPVPPLPDRPDWRGQYWARYSWPSFRPSRRGTCPCIIRWMGLSETKRPWIGRGYPDARLLTVAELEALQGLPEGYTDAGLTDLARIRLIGNAWTVPVISHILSGITRQQED